MAIRKPFFVVPVPLEGLVCSSADLGHPVSNLVDFHAIGLTWQSSSGGETHWIRGQFDEQAIDFCSIVAANAAAATTWRLRLGTTQAEVDGTAPYDSGMIDFISPTPVPAPSAVSGHPHYHSHLELGTAETASWFRIDLVCPIDVESHSGEFDAAMLVMGLKIEPSRFYNWDYEFGVEDLGSGKFSPWGVFDEEPGVVFRTLDFTLGWQTQAEFESTFRPMIEALGTRGIVHVVFDPEPTATRQVKTYMGVLKKPPFARGTRRPGYTQDFSIISMI